MKTDIQIAQEACMLPIKEVAAKIGMTEDTLNSTVSIRLRYQMILLTNVKITKMQSLFW